MGNFVLIAKNPSGQDMNQKLLQALYLKGFVTPSCVHYLGLGRVPSAWG